MHTAQSMHSSGSIARKFGPSRKQSTGQTSTQSVYLHLMQGSVTTWVILEGAQKAWAAAATADRGPVFYRRASSDLPRNL
jgi:hypothetical protein